MMNKGAGGAVAAALFFNSLTCLADAPAAAAVGNETGGAKPCQVRTDKDAASDPCNEAAIMDVAGDAQVVSATVYTLAASVCLLECCSVFLSGGVGCTVAGVAGLGADIAGSIAVAEKGGDVTQTLMTSLPTSAISIAMQLGQLGQGASTEAAKDGAKEGAKKAGKGGACIGAALNLANGLLRAYNASQSFKQASQLRSQKSDLLGSNPIMAASISPQSTSSTGGEGSGATPSQTSPAVKMSPPAAAKTALDKDKMVEMAATSGDYKIVDNFKQGTSKDPGDIAEKLAQGLSPTQAIASTFGAQLGNEGLNTLAQIDKAAVQLSQQYKEDFDKRDRELGPSRTLFEAGMKSKGLAKANSDMPDLAALMAGLMPKKEESSKEAAMGSRGPAFSSPPVSKGAVSGFHPQQSSLFEIVGGRYQSVMPHFLEGASLVSPANPVLPPNLYLKK